MILFSSSPLSPQIERNVGTNVAKMRANPESPLQVATGGRENDLKLWDGNNLEKPVFEAKNVGNSYIDISYSTKYINVCVLYPCVFYAYSVCNIFFKR